MMRALILGLSMCFPAAPTTPQPGRTSNDVDIYTAVLRFFIPPRNQVRWIELDPIPASMRDSLIRRLGNHFEGWSESHDSDPRNGGRIHLSAIERFTPDSVGVAARYQHRTKYHTNPPIDIKFLVVKRNSSWTLIEI